MAAARLFAIALLLMFSAGIGASAGNAQTQQPAAPNTAPKQIVGTIKAIDGKTITLAPDTGASVAVQVLDTARILRAEPGQTDLKNAAKISMTDLQAGDRILVFVRVGPDGASSLASTVVAMKAADIKAKQQAELEDWRKRGVGGLVSGVDAASGVVNISVITAAGARKVGIQIGKDTLLRRYAADSVRMEDAKPGVLGQIKVGDQLQARGTHSADGSQLTAEEVVSGSFRNIAGTIDSVDAAGGALTVTDLLSKKAVAVKFTPQSQIRKLPPALAQGIAFRMKAAAAGAPAVPATATGAGAGGSAPAGRQGGGQADFQQIVNRTPAATLADLQKGDAVMIVATQTENSAGVTAIMLVGGVEPILTASPSGGQGVTLSPWNLGGGGEAEAGP